MSFVKKTVLFSIGGGGYVGLELLWRRRSHPTMFALGGLCFLALGKLRNISPWIRPAVGSALCTGGELAFGLLFNRDHRIWNYSGQPGNLFGQICLSYSLLWGALTVPAVALYSVLDQKILPQWLPAQDCA